jgi:hypothetical protein
MSKTTYIGGNYTENIGGSKKTYVKEGYEINSNKQIIHKAEGGITHKNPKSPPKIEDKIFDIVMFVAGTTDPLNTTGSKHQANTEYWRGIDEKTKKETKESVNNFWHKIKELKPQFNNLHIEGNFFSWSGDNDTKERNLAAERLLDLFLRVYKFQKNQEVHLHLIGHSHGGNVINQFTELIANDEMIAKSKILKKNKFTKFPKPWKIKSITYLSTPFFQKKHKLNHSKLHSACKIINVHNEYDLTQQLIADFSLVNLEGLLKTFQMEKFKKGIETLKSVNKDTIKTYLMGMGFENSHKKRAIPAWREMAKAFLEINVITSELIKYISPLKIENSNLQREKKELINILINLQQWTYDVHRNYNAGINDGFDKITWAKNLNLTQGLKVLNPLFNIKSNPKDSYLLSLLAKIFEENKGLTDSIDETAWTPKKMAKGLSIKDVNITDSDEYNSRGKKHKFDVFLKGVQGAVQNRNLEDMLMRLFSQFIKPSQIDDILDYMDYVEYIVTSDLDTQLKMLNKNFKIYKSFVSMYNAGLVSEKDEKNIEDSDKRPGTIQYLAMKSHSLSHTQFWKDVEDGLKNAFSSGKNPGYKK